MDNTVLFMSEVDLEEVEATPERCLKRQRAAAPVALVTITPRRGRSVRRETLLGTLAAW